MISVPFVCLFAFLAVVAIRCGSGVSDGDGWCVRGSDASTGM